jgi:hypothetical protein
MLPQCPCASFHKYQDNIKYMCHVFLTVIPELMTLTGLNNVKHQLYVAMTGMKKQECKRKSTEHVQREVHNGHQ